jgi:hypothetical protein
MTEKTAELLIRLMLEIADWLTDKLKNRKKEIPNDDEGRSDTKRQK